MTDLRADHKVSINNVIYPVDDWDITQYGRNLTTRFGPGGDYDWRAGLGYGYLYSNGIDASGTRLRLAPKRVTLAVPELTEKHGSFAEVPKPVSLSPVSVVSSAEVEGATTNLTVALDAGTAADRMVVVTVHVDDLATTDYNDPATDFPTYAGVRMALRETSTTGTPGYMVFYLTNPTSGSNNIIYPNSGTKDVIVHGVSLSGVLSVDPFGNFMEATGTWTSPGTNEPATTATASDFSLLLTGVSWALNGTDTPTIAAAGSNHTLLQTDTLNGTGDDIGGAVGWRPASEDGTSTWNLTGSSTAAWKAYAVGILPAATGTFIYTFEDEYAHKHTYSGTATAAGTITEITDPVRNVNGEGAGRPEWWYGRLYVPWGGSYPVTHLATVGATSDSWTDTDWYALELCTFQNGPTPEIAAAIFDDVEPAGTLDASPARLATASSSTVPLVATDFAVFGLIGDTTTEMSAVRHQGGFLFPIKEEGFYEIDTEQFGRLVGRELVRGNTDVENGKFTQVLGDLAIMPAQDGLWLYYMGREMVQAGFEQLAQEGVYPRLSNTGTGAYTMHDRRPYSPIICGKWIWWCHATTTETGATMASRVRQRSDPPGGDLVHHMLWDGDRWKGGFWDSQNHIWTKEATTVPANRGLTVLHTGADGSPNTATRRGEVSTTHTIEFPIDRPDEGRTVQFRAARVITENWDSDAPLTIKAFRDNENTADTYGSTITTSGLHVRNPSTTQMAAGTDDEKAERWIWSLSVATASTYQTSGTVMTPDPRVISLEIDYRTPQITRYTIPADNERLQKATPDLNYKAAQVALQGLMNYGPVTVLPPDQYGNDAFFGVGSSDEVIRVDERMTKNGRVFDCYVQSWQIDA